MADRTGQCRTSQHAPHPEEGDFRQRGRSRHLRRQDEGRGDQSFNRDAAGSAGACGVQSDDWRLRAARRGQCC